MRWMTTISHPLSIRIHKYPSMSRSVKTKVVFDDAKTNNICSEPRNFLLTSSNTTAQQRVCHRHSTMLALLQGLRAIFSVPIAPLAGYRDSEHSHAWSCIVFAALALPPSWVAPAEAEYPGSGRCRSSIHIGSARSGSELLQVKPQGQPGPVENRLTTDQEGGHLQEVRHLASHSGRVRCRVSFGAEADVLGLVEDRSS